ncbi:MAG TPA: Hsp20/alpha crystallin family protein [Candidatus Humimicrobiaceae bacterium]|nr:Hsp20/alpha crystallin family protein [Candidatus Humimicrobiaceae bacterium]
MASFFEKLKKGMGIEESGEIEESSFAEDPESKTEEAEKTTASSSVSFRGKSASEEKPVRKKRARKPKKIEVEEAVTSSPASLKGKSAVGEAAAISLASPQGRSAVEEQLMKVKAEQKKSSFAPVETETPASKKNIEVEEKWLEAEGELAIDVYQIENEVVIQSAIAGVKPENLDIAIERDILTIRGNREKPFEESGDYFTQECYWGPFSREVVMPVEVDPERVEATMKDGILTIKIPKMLREKLRKIKVRI